MREADRMYVSGSSIAVWSLSRVWVGSGGRTDASAQAESGEEDLDHSVEGVVTASQETEFTSSENERPNKRDSLRDATCTVICGYFAS